MVCRSNDMATVESHQGAARFCWNTAQIDLGTQRLWAITGAQSSALLVVILKGLFRLPQNLGEVDACISSCIHLVMHNIVPEGPRAELTPPAARFSRSLRGACFWTACIAVKRKQTVQHTDWSRSRGPGVRTGISPKQWVSPCINLGCTQKIQASPGPSCPDQP